MNFIASVPLADSWGMHGDGDVGVGWLILMVPLMLLMMGGMMWMMMRGMGGGSSSDSSAPSDTLGTREDPLEILERRFAEGEISVDEYRARREALSNRVASSRGDRTDEPATRPSREKGGNHEEGNRRVGGNRSHRRPAGSH